MKNSILIIACSLILSCQNRNDYKIFGDIQEIPDSAVIDLYIDYENMGERLFSDTIIGGKFYFADTIGDEIKRMRLFMRDMQKYHGFCNLWVGKGDIKVNGIGNYLSSWTVNSKISEQVFENKIVKLTKLNQIKVDSLFHLQMLNFQNNNDDKGKIRQQIDSINLILNNIEFEFLKDNYNSKVAVIYLYKLAQFGDSSQKAKIKGLYNKIDGSYLNTLWGEGIKNELNKIDPPKIGDKILNINAFDLDNKGHQLSDYIGKYMLLDFWSSGCYPCIKSIPELRKLSEKYNDKLTIISLNMDTRKKIWAEASKKDSITWINLSDGKGTFGGASFIYGIDGFPTYILINTDGVIVDRWMGYWEGSIEQKIASLIDKK